jgi:hypothetical protein
VEYPKTYNLLVRNEETHKCVPGTRSAPAFAQVDSWLVTEKIDGTNIRLILDWGCCGYALYECRGRSDAATLPKNFEEEALRGLNANDLLYALSVIEPDAEPGSLAMIVYGEGYGPGIQKGGGLYAARKSMRVFDVRTFRITEGSESDLDGQDRPVKRLGSGLWRTWDDVCAVAHALGLDTAPVLGEKLTTAQVESFMPAWTTSVVSFNDGGGAAPCEGVVARTDPYLYDFRGNRVSFKLKYKDIPA